MDQDEQAEYDRMIDNGWYEEAEDFQKQMTEGS